MEPQDVTQTALKMHPSRSAVTLMNGFQLTSASGQAELSAAGQRVVARLGLAGRATRSDLAGQFWPDVPEQRAQGNLRSTLWRLSRVCPELIGARGGCVWLRSDVEVDVHRLQAWAQAALNQEHMPDDATAYGLAPIGELLPGWDEDWVLLERERLRQLRLHALEAMADRLGAAGRIGQALELALAAVRSEPLRESAHRIVIQLHLAEGNVVEAAQHYNGFRRLLARELGVAPTDRLAILVRDLPTHCVGLEARGVGRRC
jgi:DNA-binding SARP family transcriptional activator